MRATSIPAMSSLLKRDLGSESLENFVKELLALPKSGKTASPEHRQTLFSILSNVEPGDKVSPEIAFALPGLLAKENSDVVIPALRNALSVHFAFVLRLGTVPIPPAVTALFVKETAGTKPPIRRAFLHTIGLSFDPPKANNDEFKWSKTSEELATSLVPSLEAVLKNAVASPLDLAKGPMEGYVTLATFVHPRSPISAARKWVSLDLHRPISDHKAA